MIKMKTKAIILDFDGTLGDTQQLIIETLQQTIHHMKLPSRTDEQCRATIGLPLFKAFTTMFNLNDEEGERCASVYRDIFECNNVPGRVKLFPHVIDTLSTLHAQGYTLTIASSRHSTTLRQYAHDLGIAPYLSYIISSAEVTNAKPDPEMVIKTLEHLHLQAEEAIVVGDATFDIDMAHNAGVRAVGVTYGNGTREDMLRVHAEWIIDDFAELLPIIANE